MAPCFFTKTVLAILFIVFIYLFIYFSFIFLKFYFIFKLYNIVLVLPNIETNPPQVYLCSPSWTLLPPPSPYHPSGSSQCTSPKHPASCIEPGLATHFIYDTIRISIWLFFLKKYLFIFGCVRSSLHHAGFFLTMSCGLSSWGTGLSSYSMQAYLTQRMWDHSSPARGWTHIPCIGRQILNHWTSREVPQTHHPEEL